MDMRASQSATATVIHFDAAGGARSTRAAASPRRHQKRSAHVSKDPVFAAIAEHQRAAAAFTRAYVRCDNAEAPARRKHGPRPSPFIEWRDHSALGEGTIEKVRDDLLQLPGISRRAIWREYRDAKMRLRRQFRAARAWEKRAGLAELRREYDLADAAENRAARNLAKTKPTTLAGAAALLECANINEDMCPREDFEAAIVRNVIKALRVVPEPGAAKRAA
jgi:hypothetical protein